MHDKSLRKVLYEMSLKILLNPPFNKCFKHVRWILQSCSEYWIKVVTLKGFHVNDLVVNLFNTFSILFLLIKCVYWPGGLAHRFATRIEYESFELHYSRVVLVCVWKYQCRILKHGKECVHLHAHARVVIIVRTDETKCFGKGINWNLNPFHTLQIV
jgi:hypothetical protein